MTLMLFTPALSRNILFWLLSLKNAGEQSHFFFTELTLIFLGEFLSGLIPSVCGFFTTIRGSCLFVTGCCIAHGSFVKK